MGWFLDEEDIQRVAVCENGVWRDGGPMRDYLKGLAPKLEIGDRVILPNGTEARVTERWNARTTWLNLWAKDVWEYHVEFPSMGLGGRLNWMEDQLKVWRKVPGQTYSVPVLVREL